MRFIIIICLSCLALLGCVRTPKQAANRIHNLIERFPGVIDTTKVTTVTHDTIIKTVYIDRIVKDTAKVSATYDAIDTILINGGVDTLIIEKIRYKIQGQCTAENLLPEYAIDTLGIMLKIRYKGNEQIINLEAKQIEVNTTTKIIGGDFLKFYDPPLTKNHWFWAFVAMCVISLLLLYMHITR